MLETRETPQTGAATRCPERRAKGRSGSLDKTKKSQIEKDAPQPQVVVALGLFTTKREPSKPSE